MENDDFDPISELLMPEVSVNIDDTPLEFNNESFEEPPKDANPEHHQNGDSIEVDGEEKDASRLDDDPFSDINQENINPDQIPDAYTLEEVQVHEKLFGIGQRAVQFLRLHCTACKEHLGSAPNKQDRRYIHPLLKVLICKQCYEFYGSGDFDKDEDGSELYCRWCGQGGKVLCCAQCAFVFCQRCIRLNLGKKALEAIKESDDWTCFACKPQQIINLRVTCRALYDYVQEELRKAAELNKPERLTVDYSLCCQNKPRPTPIKPIKRKSDEDSPYHPYVEDDSTKKKKKLVPNSLPRQWQANDQEEVVCAPDLSILMGDDDLPRPLHYSDFEPPPPLQPLSPVSRNDDIQYIGETKITSLKTYKKIAPKTTPMVLNTSTHKPLTSMSLAGSSLVPVQKPSIKYIVSNKPVVTVAHSSNASLVDATAAQLEPGLHYEWFEMAHEGITSVNQILNLRLNTLSKEQQRVGSLEELAAIHNRMQEVLSTSINSLMQIRKNLRSNFIQGLKKLKFCKPPANDSDVIVVDPAPKPSTEVSSNPPRGYIKVKPVSELIGSSIITIPDDHPVVRPFLPNEIINVDEKEKEQEPEEEVTEIFNPETASLVRRALVESKFEAIVNDNLKYNVDGYTFSDVKQMLSVRVVMAKDYSPATPRTHDFKYYKPLNLLKYQLPDIEEMLFSNIVNKPKAPDQISEASSVQTPENDPDYDPEEQADNESVVESNKENRDDAEKEVSDNTAEEKEREDDEDKAKEDNENQEDKEKETANTGREEIENEEDKEREEHAHTRDDNESAPEDHENAPENDEIEERAQESDKGGAQESDKGGENEVVNNQQTTDSGIDVAEEPNSNDGEENERE